MAAAATPPAPSYADQVVRCESRNMERVHCDLDAPAGVQLARQLSELSCIRESSWGADATGVWVSHGCRAEFSRITPVSTTYRPTRRVIRCESNGRPKSCPVMLRGAPVRLLKQRSLMPCREGYSWGVKRNELWVTRGCQGEFEMGAEDGSGFVDVPRKLVCESKGGLRRECGVSVQRRVTLLRQLSETPCEEGRNWGWTRDGVWVDKGCRAEFSAN
ncbi:MAG: DUF3011 domain-containing protein [Stenotrophomonas sp.]